MYTLDNTEKSGKNERLSTGCLIGAAAVALFGAVYEAFSFGVFSYYMLYAFAFLLVGGALFWKLPLFHHKSISTPGACFWNAGLATLTTGSLLCGVLEIYGSANPLTGFFWIAGAALLLFAAILLTAHSIRQKQDSTSGSF